METRLHEIQGSEFYLSMSCHIPQLVPRGIAVFLLKHFIFLENGKNCHSIVFTVLQIHIMTESLKADSHVSATKSCRSESGPFVTDDYFYDCFL